MKPKVVIYQNDEESCQKYKGVCSWQKNNYVNHQGSKDVEVNEASISHK